MGNNTGQYGLGGRVDGSSARHRALTCLNDLFFTIGRPGRSCDEFAVGSAAAMAEYGAAPHRKPQYSTFVAVDQHFKVRM